MAPIYHLCSHIENSYRSQMRRIAVPYSKTNKAICAVLYEEGFISSLTTGDESGPFDRGYMVPITPDNVAQRRLWLDLKYRSGISALTQMKVISKPSRRVHASFEELRAIAAANRAGPLLKPQLAGQITIVDTPYGIVELKDALSKEVGGEVLF
ncbi:ribosomal protein S8 [Batrachochytrium dendrobatidis JEL423]|uniref:Ribosomal protein S8 n=1 Tax=Batrachochytrium dendrobatidis (strain JEL423) TaxID=403673 RepID=A0A177W8L0_BATDL|nr:ribosomal protein S8 [Batrachochytrium dendrobatidis JEL423]